MLLWTPHEREWSERLGKLRYVLAYTIHEAASDEVSVATERSCYLIFIVASVLARSFRSLARTRRHPSHTPSTMIVRGMVAAKRIHH